MDPLVSRHALNESQFDVYQISESPHSFYVTLGTWVCAQSPLVFHKHRLTQYFLFLFDIRPKIPSVMGDAGVLLWQ